MYFRFRCAVALTAAMALPSASYAQSCFTGFQEALLILDASGSMVARLPWGDTRINAARRAVKDVTAFFPPEAQLGLRFYGAQSPVSVRDCLDTNLAVPFGPVGEIGPAIAAAVDAARAQGYTPIDQALKESINDFPPGMVERVIVLVSDGKETCSGQPCQTARDMGRQGFIIHTIGFLVDRLAREQLQCIADATGGTYFDAPSGPDLTQALNAVFDACKVAGLPAATQPLRPTRVVVTHDIAGATWDALPAA